MSHRPHLPVILTLLLAACSSKRPAPDTVPADSAVAMMRHGLSAALQAQGDSAVAALRRIEPTDLDDRNALVRSCMLDRLGARTLLTPTVADTFVAKTLAAYQEYWLRSIRNEHSAVENEAWLLTTLDSMVTATGGSAATSMDSLETALEPILRAHGYHSLMGVTSPLRELMLWKTETPRRYDVRLPSGVQPVTIVFMDDFASLGWAGFATCDRHHTGGWTKPDRLFAVQSAYDTTSEDFRVSYLAHEGQHFWDTQHLPVETPAYRLEYRAKLVELAIADSTVYGLLEQFARNTSTDTLVPHSFANGRVVERMTAALFPGVTATPDWHTAPIARINASARALLLADTAPRGR